LEISQLVTQIIHLFLYCHLSLLGLVLSAFALFGYREVVDLALWTIWLP
jgi:hypothetical protein